MSYGNFKLKKLFVFITLIESLSLPVFLLGVALVERGIIQGWLSTYVISSTVAVITTSIVIRNKISLNRLFVGINLYLFSGAFALMMDLSWLNQLYGKMEASAMLAWIVIVGVFSIVLSPEGFIGVKSLNHKKITLFSIYLLLVALTAFAFSYYFQGNKLCSEIIPFVALFTTLGILKSKLSRAKSVGTL